MQLWRSLFRLDAGPVEFSSKVPGKDKDGEDLQIP
jgi:hypothetical protein